VSDPATQLAGRPSIREELVVVRRNWVRLSLRAHPDKGGDPEEFRRVMEAFDVLRSAAASGRGRSFVELAAAAGRPGRRRPGGRAPRGAAARAEGRGADAGGAGRGRGRGAPVPTGRTAPTVPSYEWFEEAAAEEVPGYRVELAKSDRSACVAGGASRLCGGGAIARGALRCGSLDEASGAYGRWSHLACWRVPARVWLALPDARTPEWMGDPEAAEAALMRLEGVTLSGLASLSARDRRAFVLHAMEPAHHAKRIRTRRDREAEAAEAAAGADATAEAAAAPRPAEGRGREGAAAAAAADGGGDADSDSDGRAPVVGVRPGAAMPDPAHGRSRAQRAPVSVADRTGAALAVVPPPPPAAGGPRVAFVAPSPGVGAAVPGALRGETVVLTGLFPEVGGGAGLNLGKDRTARLVESFGGRVTSSVSGKTTILLVGKEPGFSKVARARESGGRVALMSLTDLVDRIEGRLGADEPPPPLVIEHFSAGFHGNGLAASAPRERLLAAAGVAPGLLGDGAGAGGEGGRKRVAAPPRKRPAAKKRRAGRDDDASDDPG